MTTLPGTDQHRTLLQWILERYTGDPRIQTIALFGSLARGDWDEHSDIDLDIIVSDEQTFDLSNELADLKLSVGLPDPVLLALPDGPEEVKLLFASLTRMSIRFHPLWTTKAAIIPDLMILSSHVAASSISEAGMNNRTITSQPEEHAGHFIVYAVEVTDYLARGQLWISLEILHRMRRLLMDVYASSRGKARSLQAFAQSAPAYLQEQLAKSLTDLDPALMRDALRLLINLFQRELHVLSDGRLDMDENWKDALSAVCMRLADEE